jgi:hypothetical protein
MRHRCGVAIALCTLTSSLSASAVEVVVTVAPVVEGCITSDELARRVEMEFAGTELPPSSFTLHATIGVATGGGLTANVTWVSRGAQTPSRDIQTASRDCRQLDDVLPLLARALWNDEATQTTSAPAVTPPPVPHATPRVVPRTRPFVSAAPRERASAQPRGGSLALSAGVVGMLGVLDEPLLAPRLNARVSVGRAWAVRLAATYLWENEPTVVAEGGVTFSAVTGRAAGCWVTSNPLSLDACLGVDAGVLWPHVSQLEGGTDGKRPVVWPIVLLAARRQLLGPVHAEGALAAGPALARYDFYIRDAQGEPQSVRAAGPALVEASLSLGIALR